MKRFPLLEKAQVLTAEAVENVASSTPLSQFHSFAELSAEPVSTSVVSPVR